MPATIPGLTQAIFRDIRQVVINKNVSEICTKVDVVLINNPLPRGILCREQQKLDRRVP